MWSRSTTVRDPVKSSYVKQVSSLLFEIGEYLAKPSWMFDLNIGFIHLIKPVDHIVEVASPTRLVPVKIYFRPAGMQT